MNRNHFRIANLSLVAGLCFILVFTFNVTSCNNKEKAPSEPAEGKRSLDTMTINDPSTYIDHNGPRLLTQSLTPDQIKTLLTTGSGASKEVRKIIFQFIDKGNGVFGLIAYGAKHSNQIVGDSIHLRTIEGTDTIALRTGSILGALEFTRGQLKEMYGQTSGRRNNTRLEEVLITMGLRLTPSSVNGDGNTATFIVSKDPGTRLIYPFKMILGTDFLNPIPPARPCDSGTCDDF